MFCDSQSDPIRQAGTLIVSFQHVSKNFKNIFLKTTGFNHRVSSLGINTGQELFICFFPHIFFQTTDEKDFSNYSSEKSEISLKWTLGEVFLFFPQKLWKISEFSKTLPTTARSKSRDQKQSFRKSIQENLEKM